MTMTRMMTSKTSSKTLRCLWGMAAAGVLAIALASAGALQTPGSRSEQKNSYYPLALGNWWLYTVKEPSKKTTTVEWRVAFKEKEIVRGPRAYQLSSTPAQGDEPVFLALRENGIVDPDTGDVVLKSPLHVGDRWQDQTSSKPDTFEVVSAGKACVVGGRRFRDCATVREVSEAARLVTLVTYARGVGPVAYVYFKGLDSKKVDATLTIRSWHVQ